MGYYVNKTSEGKELGAKNKVQTLVDDGARIVSPEWRENLICVVDNGFFEAAAYCYNEKEFRYFIENPDPRPKTWLVHPMAKELAE